MKRDEIFNPVNNIINDKERLVHYDKNIHASIDKNWTLNEF